ncbi:MAG: enoyl-CoA hydratase-related protein [Pseudonocardiaceae bacterium]
MSEPASTVLNVENAGAVRTLTLNRPEAFNSLTGELKRALLAEVQRAASDDGVRAVVLTGAGTAFCAGQDLREHVALLDAGDPEPLRTVAEHYNPLVAALATLPKPTVAAVNGMAAGAGASLAYACDLRVAARSARFLMAFANVGLTVDSGASWTLPRLVGYGRAMEMLLLAEPVDADRALEIGMVTRVVPEGEALAAAQQLAGLLATGPTTAYAKIKESVAAAATADLPEALAVEAGTQAEAGATADHREGVAAFMAKRAPEFRGS